ncbi:MAG: hypothetical protein L6R40_008724, partial [Gallowayella cf. fulva]
MAGTGIARILKRPPVQHGAVCSANGTDDIGAWQCDRPVKIASAGLCAGCYLKHLMSAPFTRPAHLKPTTCVAVAAGGGGLCGDPVVARGRCDMHLSRRKRGTPDDAPLTVSVRGQEAAAYAAEGKKWCATCKQAKCLADFSSGSNGLTQPTCRDCRRWNQMLRTFRITRDEYETLVANQGDACGFCGTDKPGGSGQWHIDHFHGCTECHAPEKGCQFCIRSLLCNRCNMRLVADYEALPPDRQTWGDMARYLARRPILEMSIKEDLMVFDEEKELADALSAEATDRAAGVPGIADDLSVATWNGYEDETTGTYGVTASPWLLDSEDDLGDVADSSHGPRAQYRPDPRISGIVADGHMFHVRTFSNPDTPASCAHCGDQLLAGDDTSRCELAEGEAPTLKGRRGMHVWGVPVLAPVKDRPGWWYKRPTGPVRPVETLSAFRIRGKGTVVLDPGVHDVPRPGTL